MKIVYTVLVLVGITGVICSAQELKTVKQCRTYRDAWNASFNDEIPHLAVADLVHRAEQVDNCVEQVDKEPNLTGLSLAEGLERVASTRNYYQLSRGYYYELFRRMSEYMDKNRLLDGFLDADKNGRQVPVPKP
jgi:hypothetical protein